MAGVSYPERNRYSHQDFGNKRTGLSACRLCSVQHTSSYSCQWENCKPLGDHNAGQRKNVEQGRPCPYPLPSFSPLQRAGATVKSFVIVPIKCKMIVKKI